MIVVCAIDRPRSTIISTRSRKLSLKRRYQRTHRMTTSRSKWLEQLFYSLQFGHCRPRLVQHASVADRTVPFAPEPLFEVPGSDCDTMKCRLSCSTGLIAPWLEHDPGSLCVSKCRRHSAMRS